MFSPTSSDCEDFTSSEHRQVRPDSITAGDSLPQQRDESEVTQAPGFTEPSVPPPLHLREQHVDIPCRDDGSLPQIVSDDGKCCRTSVRNPDVVPHEEPPSKTPERFWFRCAGAFFALFTAGWADGVTGTVLPHIKQDFNLSYMVASLLFLTSTFGFALGVIMIEQVMCLLGSFQFGQIRLRKLRRSPSSETTRKKTRVMCTSLTKGESKGGRYGSISRARFRILVLGSILHASFFIIMGTATGLSNVLIAYFVASLGKALLNGTVNAYVAASPRRPLGQLYACNSIGAFAAPFVCQTLLARGIPWSHFYLGSLVLSAINTSLLALAFRPTRIDFIEEDSIASTVGGTCLEAQLQSNTIAAGSTEDEKKTIDRSATAMTDKSTCSNSWISAPSLTAEKDRSSLRFALKLRYVWAFSFFMCIYSGSETATQGYMATYLLVVRNANPNTVGYVTSGFWAGMAISRFVTGFATPYLSFTFRKHVIHFILVTALSMHLCIWLINSVFENAFSTAIVGLLYGPVYPSVLALAVDLLPGETHMITMAIIAGFSNLGSSIFPFIVGAMSNLRGPKVLVYMTAAQTVALIVLWMFFPTKSPRLQQ